MSDRIGEILDRVFKFNPKGVNLSRKEIISQAKKEIYEKVEEEFVLWSLEYRPTSDDFKKILKQLFNQED